MAQVNADIAANGGLAKTLNSYYAATFGSVANATVASTVAANLGLTGAALTSGSAYIAAQLNAAAGDARGAVISNIVNLFGTLAADATFGAAATAWNTKVATAVSYAGATNVAIGTQVVASAVFTLTAGADLAGVGMSSNAGIAQDFRFTSGDQVVNALSSTTAGGDTLVDGSTTDNDSFNLTATGAMTTLTAINIETANVNFASGTPDAKFTNFSGLKAVNVTGAVAGTVEDPGTATVGLNGYSRVLTVDLDSLAGTAVDGTADVLNLSVSGTQYGTTAATRSGIAVTIQAGTNATDGTLETLNITSTGTTANDFALTKDADTTFTTINLLGGTAQTVRVEHDDVTGISIVGTAATGDANVRVNRESDGTTATNVANFTDVDNLIIADDAAAPAAALVLSSVKSGQRITVADDMATGSAITFQGATRTAPAASLTLVLDNDTVNTDTDIADLDIQNVAALNLQSNGFATTSTDGAAINAIGSLVGDFTTVTITGDTSVSVNLAIDAAGALSDTARTVTVNASGLTGTAFATFTVANDGSTVDTDRLISYNITGSSNADTITATNADAPNSLIGGAGNDTITGGMGVDTIDAGDGSDLVNITVGADIITGGAGNDTFDLDISTVAVAQANTITLDNGTSTSEDTWTAGDTITVTLNGVSETYTVVASDVVGDEATGGAGNEDALVIAGSLANFINGRFGATVTASFSSGVVTVTADTAGTPFTLAAADSDATATATAAATSTVNVADVNTTIRDFAVGDVINTVGLSALGAGYFETALAASELSATGDYGVIVLAHAGFATRDLAENAVAGVIGTDTDDVVIVFLNTTTGKAEAIFDADVGADDTIADSALLLTFDNITTLTGIASTFSADSFVI
jgi:S-layer protein